MEQATLQRWKWFGAVVALSAAMTFLYLFEPTKHAFYPRCALHVSTGLACPGCGALRAMHQLSHGNVGGAFFQNPLLLVLLPAMGWYAACRASEQLFGRKLPTVSLPAYTGWVVFAVVMLFTIARNLPFESLRWLGPQ